MPDASMQHDADQDQPDGDVGADHEDPRDQRLDPGRGLAGALAPACAVAAHASPRARCAISNAVYRTTITNSQRRMRTSMRPAMRDPMDAPTNTPERRRSREVGVDLAAQQVDHRGRRGGDPDHHVAGRGGDLERDAHRHVHHRDLDDPAADARAGRTPGPRRRRRTSRSAAARSGSRRPRACPRRSWAPGPRSARRPRRRRPARRRPWGRSTRRRATSPAGASSSGSAGSSSSVARAAAACAAGTGVRLPCRIIEIATQVRTTANRPARTCSSSTKARRPPASAPIAVNSSSTMPSRRFATWRRR